MNVNDLCKGVSASSFNRHPNGTFIALVSDIVRANTQDGKRQFLKLNLKTSEGSAPDFMVFLINDMDAVQAEHDEEYRQKLVKSIAINKGVLVRLGLSSDAEVKEWGQSEMLKAFASLKGKTLTIKVEDDQKNPKYQRVTLESLEAAKQKPNTSKPVDAVPSFSLDDIPF